MENEAIPHGDGCADDPVDTDGPTRSKVEAPALRFQIPVHIRTTAHGRRRLVQGTRSVSPAVEPGSVPRVARLLALAHRFDRLIRDGHVRDLAHIAGLSHITRARATQIMNLLLLAPHIQEAVLDLPHTVKGRDPITEHDLRPIVAEPRWNTQRKRWKGVMRLAAIEVRDGDIFFDREG